MTERRTQVAQDPPVSPEKLLLSLEGYSVVRERRRGGRRHHIPLVDSIDLHLRHGEAIAIVGESGSGKTLTARAISGLLPRGFSTRGVARFEGKDLTVMSEPELATMRGRSIGMVFQDPFTMLNPVRTCGSHVSELLRDENGRTLGRRAKRAEAIRRLAEVGIVDPGVVDRYPFELSGGMRQRVGIAAALAQDPRLLIADEPSTALDVTTQKSLLRLLKSLLVNREMGLILITHDLRVAFAICARIYVLYGGAMMEAAPGSALEREPLHPYSLGLLLSQPPIDRKLAALDAMPGTVPAAVEGQGRCQFGPRCRWVMNDCLVTRPPMAAVTADRLSACLRITEIRDQLALTRRAASRVAAEAASSGSQTLLSVSDATKTYPARGRSSQVKALRDVCVDVHAGEAVGIVGESGAGKTTLARSLVGLEKLDSGEIRIGGLVVQHGRSRDRRDVVRRIRRTVQLVFQDPYSSLNPVRTVAATLGEAIELGGRPSSKTETGMLLSRVGLPEDYARRKPHALSGGERQRVAIARAMAVKPKILICDEPLSALDVAVQAQIMTLFRELQTELGISLLFITHDLAVVRQIADRIYVMSHGEVVESGPACQVLDTPSHPYTQQLLASVPSSKPGWLD